MKRIPRYCGNCGYKLNILDSIISIGSFNVYIKCNQCGNINTYNQGGSKR